MVVTLNMSMVESIALRKMSTLGEEDVLYIKDNNGSIIEIVVESVWQKDRLKHFLEQICQRLNESMVIEKVGAYETTQLEEKNNVEIAQEKL